MLGNFSFGDYFKREAIHWAWEFLTGKKWLAIDPDRLTVTVYIDDNEAANIWTSEIGLPVERVQRLGEDENFWPANAPSQGPDGVCGPCSEIYCRTPSGDVEIWNLVFTQFNRVGVPPNNLRPLPSKNIDTGMGLERTASVLQNVESNFHIDILRPLVEAAGEVCKVPYEAESESGRRMRRIADHVRACTFAIHENVYPGPNKEKYVVKRLLRRAVLDGRQMGVREPFLHQLVPVVVEMMKRSYPELGETVERVARGIKDEEMSFLATIDTGLDRIERIFQQMHGDNRGTVSGEEAAEMYQTHGFPPELFESMAAERGLAFDWAGYEKAMEQHGIESGGGKKMELFAQRSPLDALKKAVHGTKFLGYETLEAAGAKVIGLIANEQLCDRIEATDQEHPILVVLDKTPFYGEMGGQVGDIGELVAPGLRFEVVDTLVSGTLTLHRGHLREGKLALGATLTARVDASRRQAIRRAHSATHLLHYALQKHLGKHAQQQGSKVDRDLLRFDFSNPSAVAAEQLAQIEQEVNMKVIEAAPIGSKNMPLAEARTIGAMMLFGEKYPDEVRVVSVGNFSRELCGGTHLENSGQVGLFKIISEESVAAGTRRITALTGLAALEHVRRQETTLAQTAALLKVAFDKVPERVESLVKEVRAAGSAKAGGHATIQVKQTALKADDPAARLLNYSVEVHGTKVIIEELLAGATAQTMRDVIDQLRRKAAPIAVLLASEQEEGKVMVIAGLSRDLVQKGLDAVKWVKAAAGVVGGGGGGRPDMAQAGGKDAQKIPEALVAARATIEKFLAS